MKKQKTVQARLKCPECGAVTMISRKASKKKEEGHIKHMYCYGCQTVQGLEELGNIDKQVSFWDEYHANN